MKSKASYFPFHSSMPMPI